uniref:Uncharacterized protein n=1 Tax=Timema monikensis TaxID=170555 RepID=A0A7R9ELH8_9NEOP|nr:unnamed protein product [Timema monikensis]
MLESASALRSLPLFHDVLPHILSAASSVAADLTVSWKASLVPLSAPTSLLLDLGPYHGFHKVVSIEGGGLKVDKDEMEFAHQFFLLGRPYLLENIKRKIPTSKGAGGGGDLDGARPNLVTKVLTDVKRMKDRQDTLNSQLLAIKRENQVLWREVALLRQKHHKQQQIVNKLIQFLVTMVHSSRGQGLGLKRHYSLMLDNSPHRTRKLAKLEETLADNNAEPVLMTLYTLQETMSPAGPVIHELDPADLLDDSDSTIDDPNLMPQDSPRLLSLATSSLCEAVVNEDAHSPLSYCSSSEKGGKPGPRELLRLVKDIPQSTIVDRTVLGPRKANRRTKKKPLRNTNKEKIAVAPIDKKPLFDGCIIKVLQPNKQEDVDDSLGVQVNIVPEESDSLDDATKEALSVFSNMVAEAGQPETVSEEVPEPEESCQLPDLTVACAGTDQSNLDRDSLDSQVDCMQTDLDTLKELLKGENYSLDANTLLGVCPSSLGLRHQLELHQSTILSLFSHATEEVPPVSTFRTTPEVRSSASSHQGEGTEPRALLHAFSPSRVCGEQKQVLVMAWHLFNEDPLTYDDIPPTENDEDELNKQNDNSDLPSNELMTYNPNFLDLTDMYGNQDLGEWILPHSPEEMMSLEELNTPTTFPGSPGLAPKKK